MDSIEKIIYEYLDNAKENGSFEEDGCLINFTEEQIIDDMLRCSMLLEDLTQIVYNWKKDRGVKDG